MDNKSISFNGIAIMAGLIFLGLMLPQTARVFRNYERTVNVKGLCEMEVKADKVIWPLVIKVSGNDVNTLQKEVSAKNDAIVKFLTEGGVSPDEISVSISTSDKNTMEYNNDRAFRFIIKSVVTVCSGNVDAVNALLSRQSELMKSDILLIQDDWENKISYTFEGLNAIKPQMIEEATRNARASAQKFAEDSGSRLGKIKDASQGTFTISDRDSNTPSIKKVRVVSSVTYYLSR